MQIGSTKRLLTRRGDTPLQQVLPAVYGLKDRKRHSIVRMKLWQCRKKIKQARFAVWILRLRKKSINLLYSYFILKRIQVAVPILARTANRAFEKSSA